ncbi:MAG: hypothetical protein ACOC5D_05715 [Thermoplasmatota archaeon]
MRERRIVNLYKAEIDGSKIYMMGIVKGLVTEAEKVKNNMKSLDFEVAALPISKEELDGLKEFIEEDDEIEIEPSKVEKMYAERLSTFGEVSLPPPSYVSLLKFCEEENKRLESLDMDEEHYTMAYCKHVTGTQWLRQAFREKSLSRKKIKAETPKEFALKWDKVINKLKGYQELEVHREEVIAKNIKRISKKGDVFCIVEVERMEGIIDNL